jgi:hypothetical protein
MLSLGAVANSLRLRSYSLGFGVTWVFLVGWDASLHWKLLLGLHYLISDQQKGLLPAPAPHIVPFA